MFILNLRAQACAMALLLSCALAASSQARPLNTPSSVEQVLDIPFTQGGHQRVLLIAPTHPKATIIMLPGGAGDVGLSRDGTLHHADNFVVRTRALWVARGYAVLIPDTINRASLRGVRSSASYGNLVDRLIQLAHQEVAVPVFLLGTSQGSIAAMNGAAHAANGSLAGVILTESVSVLGGSHETVFNADPAGVRVPVLVVANSNDRCRVAPPRMAPQIAAATTNSPHVEILEVSGGVTQSRQDCGSLTPHGYYGIEDQVVGLISAWIQSNLHK